MDALVEEAPTNVDSLPDATEPISFESSLEAAFANLGQGDSPEPEAAVVDEPEAEPLAEESSE